MIIIRDIKKFSGASPTSYIITLPSRVVSCVAEYFILLFSFCLPYPPLFPSIILPSCSFHNVQSLTIISFTSVVRWSSVNSHSTCFFSHPFACTSSTRRLINNGSSEKLSLPVNNRASVPPASLSLSLFLFLTLPPCYLSYLHPFTVNSLLPTQSLMFRPKSHSVNHPLTLPTYSPCICTQTDPTARPVIT